MSDKPYQLLIFDWDGTLANSAALIVSTMQDAIRALNLAPRDDQAIAELIGLGFDEGLALLYPGADIPALRNEIFRHRARNLAEGPPEAPLFAGAMETLEVLAEDRYWLTVATGKSRRGLQRSFQQHPRIGELVLASRTADETASKPDPLMLRELLAELDVPVEQALMIGDTEFDVAMAQAIGMDAVGVTCGVHAPERLLAAGARALLPDVSALHGWLRAQGRG